MDGNLIVNTVLMTVFLLLLWAAQARNGVRPSWARRAGRMLLEGVQSSV